MVDGRVLEVGPRSVTIIDDISTLVSPTDCFGKIFRPRTTSWVITWNRSRGAHHVEYIPCRPGSDSRVFRETWEQGWRLIILHTSLQKHEKLISLCASHSRPPWLKWLLRNSTGSGLLSNGTLTRQCGWVSFLPQWGGSWRGFP